MIKKRFLSMLALLCLTVSGAWAQTTITQGWENGLGDWTINNCQSYEDASTGVTTLKIYEAYVHSGEATFCFYYNNTDIPQYLISPELDNNNGGTFSFYYTRYRNFCPESFKVGYSTTTNDPSAFTFGAEVTVNEAEATQVLYEYAFPAGTKYVTIACTSKDQWFLFVDDLTITINAAPAVPSWVRAGDDWDDATKTLTVNSNPGNQAYKGQTVIEHVIINNGVTSIGTSAFKNCTGITSVTIPEGVTSIGQEAFYGCSGLTSITIPNSVTSTSIGVAAFYSCTGLTSVTIGNSVTSIGDYAFVSCSGLTSVTNYAATPQTISSNVFEYVNKSSCTLYVPAESVSAYSTASVWQDFGTKSAIPTATVAVTANLANGAYWATFYSNAGNYEAPDGTQVFAVNLTGTAIEMTEISDRIVKSGQGVVLKQETESSEPTTTITMTLTETAATDSYFSDNSLLGTMTSITNPGNAYVLNYKAATGAGFYKLKSTGTIGANKAYLTYAGALAREFFLFDEATGIESIEHGTLNIDHSVYDLQGRRVQNPTKGLYIVNGKKVFINK